LLAFDDGRFDRTERSEQQGNRTGPGICRLWQETGPPLRYMEHDRAALEQRNIAFFVGRDLSEGLTRQMRRLLHLPERNELDPIWLIHFLQRPAHRHVAGQ